MEKLSTFKQWQTCILLLLLGLVSIGFGALQLNSINQGATTNTYYLSVPFPVVVHIVGGIIFNLVSPFQFVESIRVNFPKVHRFSGWLLVISAIPVTLSALWMNHFYPSYGGVLKYTGIVAYNVILITSLFLAIKNVMNKNIIRHREWMMRVVAVALAPATQRVIIIPIFAIFGEAVITDQVIGLLIWSGLIINLAVVEFIKRKNKPKKVFTDTETPVAL